MGETTRTTSETTALQGNSRHSVADIVARIALELVGALTRFFDTHVP